MSSLYSQQAAQRIGNLVQECQRLSAKNVQWQEQLGVQECRRIRQAARQLLAQTGGLLQDLAHGKIGEAAFLAELKLISQHLDSLSGATILSKS